MEATGNLLTSAVEAKTESNLLRIDVVAPEQLQCHVNLGQIGVSQGDGADEWIVSLSVPAES